MSSLRDEFAARRPLLEQAAERLEGDLVEHFEGRPHIDRIHFRVKGVESFVKKAEQADPPYELPLAEIEDQIAGRILVLFHSDLAATIAHTRTLFNPVEYEHKRPSRYNEFDYESVHGVYALSSAYQPQAWSDHEDMPTTFELQVRTLFQHAYAEPQHDLGYKPDIPPDDEIKRELAWIAAGCWGGDRALERIRQLVQQSD